MDNLFKLTKDGKCVGYLKIEDGKVWIRDTEHIWKKYQNLFHAITFDESLPYVTTDKNGEKVFAGDKVKSGLRILTIVWNKHDLRWMADEGNYVTPLSQWAIIEQFELIKDKDNG